MTVIIAVPISFALVLYRSRQGIPPSNVYYIATSDRSL